MVTLALVSLLAQQPAISGERSVVSKCDVSPDPEFGYSKAKPIKVGGSPMYGAARQRSYLQTLLGPAGQPITFRRRGSLDSGLPGILLDEYEIKYEGLADPILLYLDWYRWEIPRAPQGFVCGAAFSLAPPPPNPFEIRQKLVDVAIARSAVDSLPPIPLSSTEPDRGMLFDGLRVLTLNAREVAKDGKTPTPPDLMKIPDGMVVVANPFTCGGETVNPEGVGLVLRTGQSMPSPRALMEADELRRALPGVDIRKGAVGALFSAQAPPSGSRVAVKYRGSACGTEPALFPMTFAPAKRIEGGDAVMPEGVDMSGYIGNISVGIRFTIGPDGRPMDLSVVNGEARFAEAAMEAVRQWRYDLPTINGWPVFVPFTLTSSVRVVRR